MCRWAARWSHRRHTPRSARRGSSPSSSRRCGGCPAASPSASSCAWGPAASSCRSARASWRRGPPPDFVIVDGAEGGTGSAPLEFEDHVGMPLTEGLMLVHNSLVGTGLRGRIKVGACGKVASGVDIVTRVCQGADFTHVRAGDDVRRRLHPGPALPHEPLPHRGGDPGPGRAAERSMWRARASGCSTSSAPRSPAPPRSWRRWASTVLPSSRPRCSTDASRGEAPGPMPRSMTG